ncbi:hypothetical protein MASR2M44_13620 [Bacteroidota bacterium]
MKSGSPDTPIFKSVSRALLLVEAMVFAFMVYQTGAKGNFFLLAILQTVLQLGIFALSKWQNKTWIEWLIPIPASSFLILNWFSPVEITFAAYCISLVFYSFLLVRGEVLPLIYILSLILGSGISEYIKGVEVDVILLVIIPGMGFSFLFFTVLRSLQKTKNDLSLRNKELEESQLNYKTLIENTNSLIWSVDKDYCFLNGNTAFYLRYEFLTGKQLTPGTNLLTSLKKNSEKEFWKSIYDKALSGEQVTIEHESVSLSEKQLTWEYMLNPMKLPNGKIYGITIMAKDISKKRIFERRRQENEALLNGVLNNMPIGFQLFDQQGNLLLSNQAMKIILGIKSNENHEHRTFNVFHDSLLNSLGLNKVFADVYAHGIIKNLEMEFDFSVPENTWPTTRRKVFLEMNIFPLYNEEKQIIAVVCLSNEITRRKHTEKLMLDQNKRLEEYAFTISHILRRPIANIISLSSLIKPEDMKNEEDAQVAVFLNESTHQLDQILKELNQNITLKPDYFYEHKNTAG